MKHIVKIKSYVSHVVDLFSGHASPNCFFRVEAILAILLFLYRNYSRHHSRFKLNNIKRRKFLAFVTH